MRDAKGAQGQATATTRALWASVLFAVMPAQTVTTVAATLPVGGPLPADAAGPDADAADPARTPLPHARRVANA